MTGGISMRTKFVNVEMKMKFCLKKSIFGLVCLKSEQNAPQPKRFVNFNTFSHIFTTFKNISINN